MSYSSLNIRPMSQPVIPTDSPEVISSLIGEAIRNFNDAWVEAHGDDDFGTCGSACCLIAFGRKTKIRKLLQESGLVDTSKWDSKKAYSVNVQRVHNDVVSQNWAYKEYRMIAVRDVLQKCLPELEIFVHSWCD